MAKGSRKRGQRRKIVTPIRRFVAIHSSSHGTPRHHLPWAIPKIFNFNSQDRYLMPKIYAKSGRHLDHQIVSNVIDVIRKNSGAPQVHVVMLGL